MARHRYRKEERDLREFERLLRHASSPLARKDAVNYVTPRLHQMKQLVGQRRHENNAAFREGCLDHTGREPRGDGRPYRDGQGGRTIALGGYAILLMEVVFAGAIGATTFALSWPSAVTLGVAFMLSMTLAIKAMVSVYEKRPGMTPSRALTTFIAMVVPLSIVWLAAVYALLTLGRSTAPILVTHSHWLVPFCLALLTAVSPAVGALLLSIAVLVDWAMPFVAEADRLDRLEADIDLVSGLTRDPSDPQGPPPLTPHVPRVNGGVPGEGPVISSVHS